MVIILVISVSVAAAALFYSLAQGGGQVVTSCGVGGCGSTGSTATTVTSTLTIPPTTVFTTTTETEAGSTVTTTATTTTTTTVVSSVGGVSGLRLGFWLQESDIMENYSPQSFFDAMFLTPPYPSSLEVMVFAIQQAATNSQPCSSSSAYISASENYWGAVAQMADSYPNIQLVFEIAFNPSSSIYGLSCFQTVAQSFAQYPSVYGIGVEGEYTNPNDGLTQSILNSACSYVSSLGKQCISYYITQDGFSIPSGSSVIAHTNFPGGDAGGYDQVGSLGITDAGIVGLDSGYYTTFNFPGTVTCPIGASAMTSSTAGWNQCVVSTELGTAANFSPASERQFLEIDVGFDGTGYFKGVSGQTTNQLWDNPTLRSWIWNDLSYASSFLLSV